jgi:hypothetical protein
VVPIFTHISPNVLVKGDSKLLHEIADDWAAEYRKHYMWVQSDDSITGWEDDLLWEDVCSHHKGLCRPAVVDALHLAQFENADGDTVGLMFDACEFSPTGCGKNFGGALVSANGITSWSDKGKSSLPQKFAVANSFSHPNVLSLTVFEGCNSFSGDTPVLMADGDIRAISRVKPGDTVADASPGAKKGTKDQAHAVTGTHVTFSDRNYVDVTIDVGDGTRTITGTAHHLYWDETSHSWTRASRLSVGDRLQSEDGDSVLITGLRRYTASMVTYNLTVDNLHTYYVLAGTAPVLVHNCDEDGEYLYRGVPKGHYKYDDALKGRATPRGGHSDPGLHAGGNTESDRTSWTHDYAGVALDAAEEFGPGGVVLRIPRSEIPEEIDTQIHGTELESYEEMEHALLGPVEGAEISIDRGPWVQPEG